MILCIISYLLLGIIFVFQKKVSFPRHVLVLFLVGNTIASLLFGWNLLGKEAVKEVQRNTYGTGTRVEEYTVSVEGEPTPISMEIKISERKYTEEELQNIFAKAMRELDTIILGDNTDFDCIEYNLNLVTSIKDIPVQIHWVMDNYQVLNFDGTIREEYAVEEGTLVELRGYLSLQEKEAVYVRNVMVYPKREKSLSMEDKIRRVILEKDRESMTEEKLMLPHAIDGKKLTWKQGSEYRGYVVWALGLLMSILVVFRKKEKEKEKRKKQEEEMLQDYPKIVGAFTLLLETGMTVRNAWTKIVQTYEKHREETGERKAYAEMSETYYRMQSGVAEAIAYEQFGDRCGLVQYRKFGALLSQNLRKGSKGLAGLLLMESIQSTEEKKNRMKQKAEESGTKLLIPMFAMLGVVLIMVVVPAFMKMQI